MTQLTVTVDTGKAVAITALVKDSTEVFINDTTMKLIFGPSAHLQETEKLVLACVEDLCVPYSKKSSKGQVMQEKGVWYLHLNAFCVSIGKQFQWKEPGKSIGILTPRK